MPKRKSQLFKGVSKLKSAKICCVGECSYEYEKASCNSEEVCICAKCMQFAAQRQRQQASTTRKLKKKKKKVKNILKYTNEAGWQYLYIFKLGTDNLEKISSIISSNDFLKIIDVKWILTIKLVILNKK